LSESERWGVDRHLADLGEGAAEGADPGAGGRSGAAAGDVNPDETGGTQTTAETPGRGIGTPQLGGSGDGPGAPTGTPGALTPNDDLVGGEPEEREAGG
jgi:hypothetical protein